ncbi:hypothetical protein BBP00_00003113 [Phytophthora kernoviae]|uniref:V-SNARE coiled-coil homology domain-containing protein n=1 Tax=Phytophthora kernoviae TaxID=325452 RepID=A0A3F2RVD3_9STRA|nr:hypothetical protein BBP00_00003113 [Phytophthora kernoviae]
MGNKTSRTTSASQQAIDVLLSRPTALQPSMFSLHASAHHGVPSNSKALAYCSLQGLLAVGTAAGAVKLFGAEGLEVLLEAPETQSHLVLGVTHLQFTARQRLVVAYTDSSIRIFDLATASILAHVPDSWTTTVITTLETISYTNFPFFFVATDDGEIHVIQEETGRVSTYVIRPQDLTVPNAEGVTAMASHPRDSNLLLIAYDTCPAVLMWDFAKRKVVREFTLTGKLHKAASPQASLSPSESSSADGGETYSYDSPQSLSWHSSGKRFVAGFKQGGFAVFRVDKSHGLYRYAAASPNANDKITSVKQIKWVCAPPSSRLAHLPGAIMFAGGRPDASESNLLTLIHPPNDGRPSDDALVDLFKSEKLMWSIATIESANHAEITTFVAAQDQVDHCVKMAPLSVIVLSGNPLDGCLPTVSVQCLPCFVKLCDGDKEEWEWRPERLPEPVIIPPLLQASQFKTFALVSLSQSDSALQDDLISTWKQEKHDPMFRLLHNGDFEWPVNGGSVLEPMLKGFIASSGVLDNEGVISLNSTLLVTGHANGHVLFWETQSASDHSSKGGIKLLHVVDISLQMTPAPVNTGITCLTFCDDSRTLVVGFTSGEVAVLEFTKKLSDDDRINSDHLEEEKGTPSDSSDSNIQEVSGFRVLFSIHVHNKPISKFALSSSYGYVAVADGAGMVSLVHLKTQAFQVLVCEIAPVGDEPTSVDSLLMSELVQTTEIPGSGSSPTSLPGGNGSGNKSPPVTGPTITHAHGGNVDITSMVQHREVIPIIFVGRGSGKLEMYHVPSATKMGETLVDPQKAASLSSIIMIDGEGKRIKIPGRKWTADLGVHSAPTDNSITPDMVDPELPENAEIIKASGSDHLTADKTARQTSPPSADFEYTQQIVLESMGEQAKSATGEGVVVQTVDSFIEGGTSVWKNVIEVVVPSGSIGLHLFMEVQQHAMVKGFAEESSTGAVIKAKGVRAGHILTSVNGVELSSLNRDSVCNVLEKLRDREKLLVFVEGLEVPVPAHTETESNDSLIANTNIPTDIERPRFLVCTCGNAIHVLLATVPCAAEMAMGPKEIPAQPLASFELAGSVLVASVVRVPVSEGVENCLAVVDQSNRVYILSLLSLQLIWEADFNKFDFGLGRSGLVDGSLAKISYSGELWVANSFGEMERFALFAEPTTVENSMLERKCIKTRLHLAERMIIFDQATPPSSREGAKKRGIADAGKMFKKLVLSVTHEPTDLNKVFQFSSEEDERKRLMGDRAATAAKEGASSESDVAKIEHGTATTKDTLMQAQQRLAERGEKLSELGLKTEQMKKTSEDFYQTMKAFNEKNANKKWYEF